MAKPDEFNAPYPELWAKAPAQFKYPWGYVWHTMGGGFGDSFTRIRPRGRARYSRRRLTRFQLKMLNRITTTSPKIEPPHPDQLYLF